MKSTTKLTAEQKGILLKELLSFLLAKNGRAKKEDVSECFLSKSRSVKISEDEYAEQIESLSIMCVKAEWLKKAGFWAVTKYGKVAYERFSSPRVLFQEMAVQSVFGHERPVPKKKSVASLAIIGLVVSPCTLIGFLSANPLLFYLSIAAILLLLTSLVLYNSRTRLIILGRALMIEFLILCYTLVMDVIFMTTSLQGYFQVYFFIALVIQAVSIVLVFVFPRLFSTVFEFINHSSWLIIIPIVLLILLFGGKSGHGGLLKVMYGRDIDAISGTITMAALMGIGLIFILGGIVSNLVRVGYYD